MSLSWSPKTGNTTFALQIEFPECDHVARGEVEQYNSPLAALMVNRWSTVAQLHDTWGLQALSAFAAQNGDTLP
jgi:hypothetical protein